MWGREKAGNGVGGCAGFRSGVMAEVSFRTKDKMYALLLLYRNFTAVLRARGPGISPRYYERGPWLPS